MYIVLTIMLLCTAYMISGRCIIELQNEINNSNYWNNFGIFTFHIRPRRMLSRLTSHFHLTEIIVSLFFKLWINMHSLSNCILFIVFFIKCICMRWFIKNQLLVYKEFGFYQMQIYLHLYSWTVTKANCHAVRYRIKEQLKRFFYQMFLQSNYSSGE